MAGGERHLDLHERHGADDVAVADAVTIDTSMRRRSLALAIWRGGDSASVLASSPPHRIAHIGDVGDFRRRRQLLAAVEGSKQGDAHQHAGGHARKKGAGKPAGRDLAPVRRAAAAVRDQRRLVAEVGYGLLGVLHEAGVFPDARLLSFLPRQLPAAALQVNEGG